MDPTIIPNKLRATEPRGSIYLDQYYSEESGDDSTAPRLVAKKIKKLGYRKKKYKIITNKMREELIDAIENQNEKIKDAAKRLHMNYSSAKSILQVYKKEGRLNKKGFRRKSTPKQEFSEDQDLDESENEDEEEDEEVIEKAEFVKQESSPVISIKEAVRLEDKINEETPRSSQRALRAKTQLLPKAKSPCKVASIAPIKQDINSPPITPPQYTPERSNYHDEKLSPFNFLPSTPPTLTPASTANNSYYLKASNYNNYGMINQNDYALMNLQSLLGNNQRVLQDNTFAFKVAASNSFQDFGVQKPIQRSNFPSCQETSMFMQKLIQNNFFPSRYPANNGYWSSPLINNNQFMRPDFNKSMGNIRTNVEFNSLYQYPKVEDSDI